MRHADINKMIKKLNVPASKELDNKIQSSLSNALPEQKMTTSAAMHIFWSKIMRSTITKLATAAVIIIAVAAGITFFEKTTSSAYAISDSIEALSKISTVHMFCTSWDNKKFEIWMTLDSKTGCPEKTYIEFPDYEATIISTPTTSYEYSKKINQVKISQGQKINMDVRLKNIFEDIQAKLPNEQDSFLKTYKEDDPNFGKEVLIVLCGGKDDAWKIIIDQQTKLPLAMHCLRHYNKADMFIKDIDRIFFDEELPQDIFDFKIPDGATVRDSDREDKLLNDPNCGISTEGLTQKEAISQIAAEFWAAIISSDIERLKKVYPIATDWNESIYNGRIERVFGKTIPIQLLSIGEPRTQEGCGIGPVTPCILKCEDGTTKKCEIITKFRQIEGKSSCVFAGIWGLPEKIESTQ